MPFPPWKIVLLGHSRWSTCTISAYPSLSLVKVSSGKPYVSPRHDLQGKITTVPAPELDQHVPIIDTRQSHTDNSYLGARSPLVDFQESCNVWNPLDVSITSSVQGCISPHGWSYDPGIMDPVGSITPHKLQGNEGDLSCSHDLENVAFPFVSLQSHGHHYINGIYP